jgi:hypothetical protein
LERLAIFSQWCLPSVCGQKTPFDGWLLLVAEGLADSFRASLEELLPPFAEILEIPEGEPFTLTLETFLGRLAREVITTRVDADDAISRDFTTTVRRRIRRNRVLNLRHGYQYFLGTKGLLHRDIKSNPFISLWSTDHRHVYSLGIHSKAGLTCPVDEIWTSRPMYLKIAHSGTTAHNQLGGVPVVFRRVSSLRFGLSTPFARRSLAGDWLHLRALFGGAYDRLLSRWG